MHFGYYTSTQQRIQTLAENNAKLEVAIEKSEKSINLLKSEAVKNAELNKELTLKLQKAEAYGDDLRKRLRKLDLLADAISNAKNLEGRMNGATANFGVIFFKLAMTLVVLAMFFLLNSIINFK